MGEKLKDNTNFVFSLLKSALFGVIVSVILVLVLAFILKFVEMTDKTISIFDEIIKLISIFLSVISIVKKSPYKILYKGAMVAGVYNILTFILFSALKGSYNFSFGFIIDVIFACFAGIIVAIIINIFKKEKVTV